MLRMWYRYHITFDPLWYRYHNAHAYAASLSKEVIIGGNDPGCCTIIRCVCFHCVPCFEQERLRQSGNGAQGESGHPDAAV